MTETVYIQRLGHRGDGIADGADGPVYVPYTLPGEQVEIERDGTRGRPVRVIAPSPARTEPVCRHFGTCGGCSLQHMRRRNYLAWKREQLVNALGQRGLDSPVDDTVAVPPATRRRTGFSARFVSGAVRFGFHGRSSDEVVPVEECPILMPEIERAIPDLARWLGPLVPIAGEMRIGVTATPSGLDVAVDGARPRPPALMAAVAAGARRLNVARLSIGGDVVLQNAEPEIDIDGVRVGLPTLPFLQAAEPAERALAAIVLDGLGKVRRVVDLYAGVGTFALRLARRARVLAVESDASALAALDRAARRASGLKPVETLRRDLDRAPLSAGELSRFDAAVLDPPRAGAKAQAEEVARSSVVRVAAVSCNPATFARDLRILVDGGMRITRIVPVDQFLYSPHIEAVALLERPGRSRHG